MREGVSQKLASDDHPYSLNGSTLLSCTVSQGLEVRRAAAHKRAKREGGYLFKKNNGPRPM